MVEAAEIWNAAIEAAAALVTVMGAPIGSTPAVAAAIRALKRPEPCARRADCDPELSNSPDPPRDASDPLKSKGNNRG